jgi:hypothetical protein
MGQQQMSIAPGAQYPTMPNSATWAPGLMPYAYDYYASLQRGASAFMPPSASFPMNMSRPPFSPPFGMSQPMSTTGLQTPELMQQQMYQMMSNPMLQTSVAAAAGFVPQSMPDLSGGSQGNIGPDQFGVTQLIRSHLDQAQHQASVCACCAGI